MLEAQQGRPDSAVQLLRQALERDPDIAELQNNLGMALYSLQRTDEAIAAYRKAIGLRPAYALAYNNLGVALAALDRADEAIAAYEAALAIQPDYVEALSNLGTSLHALDRGWEAVKRFREALTLQPDFVEARINLGHALSALGRADEAIPCYQAGLRSKPADPLALVSLATALRETGRYSSAAEHYQKAIALNPDLAPAHAGLGTVLLESGKIDEARRCYQRAADLEPRCPSHFLGLARSTSFTPEHPDLSSILDLAGSIGQMRDADKVDAHFALAKALADIGDQPQSFAHQLAGNTLKRRSVAYDETRALGQLRRIQEVFTADLIERGRHHGIASPHPIFIVGMPRSGSTLVEQMLASHGQVFGAGEVEALSEALRMVGLTTAEQPFPETVPGWTADHLGRAAGQYLRLLGRDLSRSGERAKAKRITDKMLANFRYIGLIHLMLPNARIIHTRRDPVDSCLSCFSLQFASLPYTYDLGELGRYYAAYSRLMDHWRAVLPTGRMLEVQYEQVVYDFEATARRIIAYCGLEWDEACLRFYETPRPVRTSSLTQVRRPIYRHAIGRWRPDADVLRPLLEALGSAGDRIRFVARAAEKITERTDL